MRLRSYRRRLKASQHQVARKLAISQASVSRMEQGEVTLRLALQVAVASGGEVMPWDLEGLPEDEVKLLRDFQGLRRRRKRAA